MPDDLKHFTRPTPRAHAFRVEASVLLPANSNPSVRELLSRNGELAMLNSQLTVALAVAQSASVAPAPQMAPQPAPQMANLTPRQCEVMRLVLAGHPSKNIAADLRISQRTVENHRAAIMHRMGAASLPALVRLSLGME